MDCWLPVSSVYNKRTLATGESIAAVAPTVLASVNALLNGDEVAVWLGSQEERPDGSKLRLRRAWGVGFVVSTFKHGPPIGALARMAGLRRGT